MKSSAQTTLKTAVTATLALALAGAAHAQSPAAPPEPVDFLLVNRSLEVTPIRLSELNDAAVIQRERSPVKVSESIALINPAPSMPPSKVGGTLSLADGQRLPGEPADSTAVNPGSEIMAWNHPWLGRMDVPLKTIQSITLKPGVAAPTGGAPDAVVLINGDRYNGFISAMGNPLSIELVNGGRSEVVEIPLDRIAAISMASPKQSPKGKRIWFGDGTVIDVQSISVNSVGEIQLAGSPLVSSTPVSRMGVTDIAAILFDGAQMLSLSSLSPSRIESPPTRFITPNPRSLDPAAALDLSRIELRGPLIVRYALPAGVVRLAAQAELAATARDWGDCEVVVRSDDAEVFRARLNRAAPAAPINVALSGRELTIELTQGAHGPIQDTVILHRAMLLRR